VAAIVGTLGLGSSSSFLVAVKYYLDRQIDLASGGSTVFNGSSVFGVSDADTVAQRRCRREGPAGATVVRDVLVAAGRRIIPSSDVAPVPGDDRATQ
jgi:hypothetical protein